ncbi:diguanylate cyclase [Devosia sp. WQ 349]|uniref:sensor domain-containing diguanylate cyclase n=1 Tax=Devosia sp. WQ 349K1 TaxID=2800329 RepID=UPI001905C2E3|nr:diguanylate cyclase [Devosia sp. WQ 349K1]MBK1794146.1 diguanylate cyclase [Devosia sp. WQ 349K1]
MTNHLSIVSLQAGAPPKKSETLSRLPVGDLASTIISALPSPAAVLNRQGLVLAINGQWQDVNFQAETTSLGSSWMNLVEPGDRYVALSCFSETAANDRTSMELRLLTRSGMSRWHVVTLSPLSEDTVLCVATDIDAIRRREGLLETKASMQTQMLDISLDCIKLITPDGMVLHMNKSGCRALGVPEDSSFGMAWLDLLPDDVRQEGRAAIEAARNSNIGRFAGRSVIPGEAPQHWDNSLTPVLDANGQTTAILVVSREVSAQHAANQSLRQSEERLSMAANVGGLGIWDYDIRADKMVCDDNWYRIVGRDPAQPISSVAEFGPMIHPEDVQIATEVRHTAEELLATGEDYRIVFRVVHPDGEVRWVRSAAAIQTQDGQAVRATGFMVDVTESVLREQALQEQNQRLLIERESLALLSSQDALTGVANRRELDDRLGKLWADAKSTGIPLAIVMVDVDHFKEFNDHYGHLAGDAVLKRVAEALLSLTRSTDLVARYGGEEFLMALPGVIRPVTILNRINEVVRELDVNHLTSHTGRLTVSAGCAVGANVEGSVEHLIARADEALYQAKQQGRDRYVINTAGEA